MSDWIEISIPTLRGKECEYLQKCIKTNFVSSVGPFVSDFESSIADNIGLPPNSATATSSGTTALQLGLLALGVKPNDLVIVPTYTFIATANAVSHVGASPWILKSEMDYLTIDPNELEKELEFNTYKENGLTFHKETKQRIACIVPVYIFGCPPNIDPIKIIASKFSIPILLDSACGLGAKYKGSKIGQTNLPGIISFNGNKTITTGAGGIFYSNDKIIVNRVKHLSSTAKSSSKYEHNEIGYNYRMSNIQAALGLAQLEQLEEIINQKKLIHINYKQSFNNCKQFTFISNPTWGESSHWLNAIVLKKGILKKIEQLIHKLRDSKIRANYFWKPLHLQKPYKKSLKSNLSELNDIQERILVLPSSPSLNIEEQEKVIDIIKKFFK
tara:strand:+ start:1272 stop:2429 length:1158 start_codon:yes stop_codon:yes gene_type:complete